MRRLQALLLPEEFKAPHAEPPLWSLQLSAGLGPAICLQRTPADKSSLPSWEMQGRGVTQNPPGPISSAHSAADQGPGSEDVVSCSRQTDRQTDRHPRLITHQTVYREYVLQDSSVSPNPRSRLLRTTAYPLRTGLSSPLGTFRTACLCLTRVTDHKMLPVLCSVCKSLPSP